MQPVTPSTPVPLMVAKEAEKGIKTGNTQKIPPKTWIHPASINAHDEMQYIRRAPNQLVEAE